MNAARKSLRMQIHKWFGCACAKTIHITRTNLANGGRVCCVTIQATQPDHSLVVAFFRHGDGSWQVYPPQAGHQCMSAHRRTA
jgi:hypothetical protein